MGGYIDFINSMLNLRSQRLKEEELEQKERLIQQEAMMDMVGDIGKSITKFGAQSSQDQMANRMMQEYGYGAQAAPPRAGEVNVPWSNQRAAGMPDMYPAGRGTGGLPELKMRIEMEELGGKRMDDAMKQRAEGRSEDYLTLAKQRETRTAGTEAERLANQEESLILRQQAGARADEVARLKAEQKVVDDAMTSFKAADPKFQAQAKNAEAYNKGVTAALQAMSGQYATQESYLQGLQKIDALYAGAESQGLKVDRPKIASWEDMQAAAAKQKAIDAANAGYWTWSKEAEQKEAARLTGELQGMPGYTQHPARVNPENFIARPSMERPEPPDIEALRASAKVVPSTATPTGTMRKLSPEEGSKLIGKPVRSGQKFTDPVTKELIIIE